MEHQHRMPVHAGMYRRYLSRIERRAQIDAFNHRGELVSDRVEPHGHLRVFADIQYNPFGARPSRGLGNVGVGLMAIRQGQFVDGQEKKATSAMPPIATDSMCRFELSRSAITGAQCGGSEVRIILARGAKPADLPVERLCYHFRPAQSPRSSGALPIQNDSPLPEGLAGTLRRGALRQTGRRRSWRKPCRM